MRFLRSLSGRYALATILAGLALTLMIGRASAATTVPQTMVYNARLLTSAGTPISAAHYIRFSFWKSADAALTDVTATGALHLSSGNYAGWNEVQTVTPDSNGYFSVNLGSATALPAMDSFTASQLQSLFLQVEVKSSVSDDTGYEILDPKPLDAAADRSPMLSVPFALNADRLDQRDIGTGSGSIPLLQSGGLLPVSAVPGGTHRDSFTLDSDNSASTSIVLKFGDTLNKTLLYSITNNRFEFNADVRIGGNLTVTGLVNGVDLNSLISQAGSPLRASSGAGLQLNVAGGGYRINGNITDFTGSSAILPDNSENYLFFTGTGFFVRPGGFPTNVSFIPVARVTTAAGAITAIEDRRVMSSDNRENSILNVLHPEFKDAAYKPDGADNVGQLSVSHDDAEKTNYYLWTTTRDSLQDFDVIVEATLPAHFTHWGTTPVTLRYRTSQAASANNKLDVQIYDTAGNAVSIAGGSTLASTTWASSGITFSGTPTWTPGDTFLIKIKVSAKNAAEAHIGDLELRYTELEQE